MTILSPNAIINRLARDVFVRTTQEEEDHEANRSAVHRPVVRGAEHSSGLAERRRSGQGQARRRDRVLPRAHRDRSRPRRHLPEPGRHRDLRDRRDQRGDGRADRPGADHHHLVLAARLRHGGDDEPGAGRRSAFRSLGLPSAEHGWSLGSLGPHLPHAGGGPARRATTELQPHHRSTHPLQRTGQAGHAPPDA